MPVIDVRGLHVRFGEVEAVTGRRPDGVRRPGQRAARSQRCRQVDDDAGAGRASSRRARARSWSPAWTSATHTLAVKQRSGYCPDVGGLVPRATPWEHLQLSARLRRMVDWEDRARAPAGAVRARRRRAPGHRRLLARHGPPAVGDPRGVPRAPGAAARRALRRRRPDRRRGDLRRDRRRPCPRRLRAGLHAPARAGHPGLQHGRWCCAAASGWRPSTAGDMAGEDGARAYRALLD